jgi:hypothetical protein
MFKNSGCKLLTPVLFIVGVTVIIVSSSSSILIHFNRLITRFNESGLSSSRFDLYILGLNSLLISPLGGFSPKLIYDTNWFHNIWLDIARLGGWFSLGLLLISFLYLIKAFCYKRKHKKFGFAVWLCFIAQLIMLQDVVLEGNYRIFIVFYLSSITILCRQKVRNRGLCVR